MDVKQNKIETRKRILALRDALTDGDRAAASAAIGKRLSAFAPYADARTVMFFITFRSEVRTRDMVTRAARDGKRVVVPVSNLADTSLLPTELRDYDKELSEGTFGVLEPRSEFIRPVEPAEIDFVVTPGSVFDRAGNRVGYGKGFYDRFRDRLRPGVTYVALAYSLQIIDSVPVESHDRKVEYIITEREIIDCRKN